MRSLGINEAFCLIGAWKGGVNLGVILCDQARTNVGRSRLAVMTRRCCGYNYGWSTLNARREFLYVFFDDDGLTRGGRLLRYNAGRSHNRLVHRACGKLSTNTAVSLFYRCFHNFQHTNLSYLKHDFTK